VRSFLKHKIKKQKYRFTLRYSYKTTSLRKILKNEKIFFDGSNKKFGIAQSPNKNYKSCKNFTFDFDENKENEF
jgi:hypothetical protein